VHIRYGAHLNRTLAESAKPDAATRKILATLRGTIDEIGEVLGLFRQPSAAWLAAREAEKAQKLTLPIEEIERLIAERAEARKNRNFARSDEIRDYLLSKNVQLLDAPGGTTWQIR